MRTRKQLNLDPANWETARKTAHQIIDETFDFIRSLDTKPCWKPLPEQTKRKFKTKVPAKGIGLQKVYEEYRRSIFESYQGNVHPAWFAWIQGGGNITSALADFLGSAFNANASIGDHAARYVEQQVLDWCKEMFHLPAQSTGLLLSGSSMANLTAITAAKNAALAKTPDIDRLTIYCSTETHSCILKAARNIGFRENAIRFITVNEQCQIDIALLNSQLKADREHGFVPAMLIANAGTVNTGAIDPLDELLKVSKKNKLWLHIDGAYGLPACLCKPKIKALGKVNKADSWAFDFHKLFNISYDVGCVFVKEDKYLHQAFTVKKAAHHLYHTRKGIAGSIPSTDNIGFELSRNFKALKIWMTIKEFGLEHIVQVISQKMEQAKHLQQQVEDHPHLQLVSAAQLSIVTFRYVVPDMDEAGLDDLNRKIVLALQLRGIAAPSVTVVKNRTAIRTCITNHRTRSKHLEMMIEQIEKTATNLLKSKKNDTVKRRGKRKVFSTPGKTD